MKRYCLISILLISISAYGQRNFYFGLGGGLNFDGATAGNVGLGYNLGMGNNFGLRTGIDFSFLNARTPGDRSETYALDAKWHNTPEGYQVRNTAWASDIEQRGRALYLQVPVIAQYRTGAFYGAGGVKFGIPLSGSYTVSARQLSATGYSEYSGQTFANMPSEGFTTFTDLSNSSGLGLRFAVLLSLEAGLVWDLQSERRLYTGVFMDYSLTGLTDAGGAFVEYNGANAPVLSGSHVDFGKAIVGLAVRMTLTKRQQ